MHWQANLLPQFKHPLTQNSASGDACCRSRPLRTPWQHVVVRKEQPAPLHLLQPLELPLLRVLPLLLWGARSRVPLVQRLQHSALVCWCKAYTKAGSSAARLRSCKHPRAASAAHQWPGLALKRKRGLEGVEGGGAAPGA